jgi:ribosomal protein S24E
LSTIEIVNENDNKLLSRKEYVLNFRGGSGLVSRQAATEAVATKLGVPKEGVNIVSLRGKFGERDLRAVAFVYSDQKAKASQLPKYMLLRELSKEERKKVREAEKAKASAAQAAGSPAEAPAKKA